MFEMGFISLDQGKSSDLKGNRPCPVKISLFQACLFRALSALPLPTLPLIKRGGGSHSVPCTEMMCPLPVIGTLAGSKSDAQVGWESGEGFLKSLAFTVRFAEHCLKGSEFG